MNGSYFKSQVTKSESRETVKPVPLESTTQQDISMLVQEAERVGCTRIWLLRQEHFQVGVRKLKVSAAPGFGCIELVVPSVEPEQVGNIDNLMS